MFIIFAICFILSFYVTSFKLVTEHCTCGTVCIRVCYVYCTDMVIRYLGINRGARVLVRNVWAQTNSKIELQNPNSLTSLMMINWKIEMKSATAIQQ